MVKACSQKNDNAENGEVEEHVEQVQPKVLAESSLFGAPWLDQLHPKKERRQRHEPPKIVMPPRINPELNFLQHVIDVIPPTVYKNFFHA